MLISLENKKLYTWISEGLPLHQTVYFLCPWSSTPLKPKLLLAKIQRMWWRFNKERGGGGCKPTENKAYGVVQVPNMVYHVLEAEFRKENVDIFYDRKGRVSIGLG